MQRIELPLAEARKKIQTADLLLYRPQWWALHSALICRAGRTEYSHAGMAVWERLHGYRTLRAFEMVASGGRKRDLAWHVEQYSGLIDVYRANANGEPQDFDRELAGEIMATCVRRRYGFFNMVRVALYHLPFVRLLMRPETDDEIRTGYPPFCSQAVAAACRGGGRDPVPQLSDRLTEPADLARSRFFAYQFTLVP